MMELRSTSAASDAELGSHLIDILSMEEYSDHVPVNPLKLRLKFAQLNEALLRR